MEVQSGKLVNYDTDRDVAFGIDTGYLMMDDKIASLMAPFKSAYENKANDQLEGMVGTLRVNAARLVSPEAYWVFTGDDFDLKISDPVSPSYLVIANDPEKEQVIGSLNALVLNRLITRVNSKGNIPVSIIVDELPTLYFRLSYRPSSECRTPQNTCGRGTTAHGAYPKTHL